MVVHNYLSSSETKSQEHIHLAKLRQKKCNTAIDSITPWRVSGWPESFFVNLELEKELQDLKRGSANVDKLQEVLLSYL